MLEESIKAETVTRIVLTVLEVHYQRRLQAMQEILSGFQDLDSSGLNRLWGELHQKAPNDQMALTWFTEWIDASLDGGNLAIPETN